MYNLDQIKILHFEPTTRCQASCPMCARNIQGGINNPFITQDDVSLQQFKKWFPVEFIQQLNRFYMCGNVGEPIMAKEALEMYDYVKSTNPTIQLSLNTNGSARDKNWWRTLAKIFGNSGSVRFGIDGLEDTHHLYRIGTDWNKIIDNARTFIDSGGSAIWDMLVFEHNSHQVEACKELSQELGFKQFYSKHTNRFRENQIHVLNKKGQTSHFIFPSIKSKEIKKSIENYKIEQNKIIYCKVKKEFNLYVNAHGSVYPCCWLDIEAQFPMNPSRIDYLDRIFSMYSLKENSLEKIFKSDYFTKIESTWNENPLRECSKQCGQIDKFYAQF